MHKVEIMKIKDITDYLESVAPLSYQESYDNSGLIVGDQDNEVTGALLCLDSTEEIIEEAVKLNCNLVIAHHPIVFSGLKKIAGRNYIERTIIKAIKNDIAIYAIHTNLDNVHNGVNAKLAEKIGLLNARILTPKSGMLKKLIVFCPEEQADDLRNTLFDSGAGHIGNYDQCSFNSSGMGSFRGLEGSDSFIGKKGERHNEKEVRIEVVFPAHLQGNVVKSMINAHPYEEVAYDILSLNNQNAKIGSGMIGELPEPLSEIKALEKIKLVLKAEGIRYTKLKGKEVKTVAICGGSGSFLLGNAIASKADLFITGDFKYHQFFDADNQIVVVDVGHYESEQYTSELLSDLLTKKFPKFAIRLTEICTNPINYL